MKDQAWFEMGELRRRFLADSVWVPLRGDQYLEKNGEHGHEGYSSEYVRFECLAVPNEFTTAADSLTWSDLSHGHSQYGYVKDGK